MLTDRPVTSRQSHTAGAAAEATVALGSLRLIMPLPADAVELRGSRGHSRRRGGGCDRCASGGAAQRGDHRGGARGEDQDDPTADSRPTGGAERAEQQGAG